MKMIEKYFYMDARTAQELLEKVKGMKASGRGIDRQAFLTGEYAVLSCGRLKLRNVVTRDEDLAYLDEIIHTLWRLHQRGVAAVPILGYCCDPKSDDGSGYLFCQRARGRELYDDGILTKFQVWAQNRPEGVYLSTSLDDREAADYLLSRTQMIAQISQEQFDRFVFDALQILAEDILIDCNGKSNFFYDPEAGFQFIDLDSHNDYRYGLAAQRMDMGELACLCGFVPCHYAEGTEVFAGSALSEQVMRTVESDRRSSLKLYNQMIFEKCRAALRNNGISESTVNAALKKHKFFG